MGWLVPRIASWAGATDSLRLPPLDDESRMTVLGYLITDEESEGSQEVADASKEAGMSIPAGGVITTKYCNCGNYEPISTRGVISRNCKNCGGAPRLKVFGVYPAPRNPRGEAALARYKGLLGSLTRRF